MNLLLGTFSIVNPTKFLQSFECDLMYVVFICWEKEELKQQTKHYCCLYLFNEMVLHLT